MATAQQMGYNEGSKFDYFAAGQRSKNMSVVEAGYNFDNLAEQFGVNSGMYQSWDQFWLGYYS